MKIHEYQAMALFKEYGVNIAPYELVDTPAGAFDAARKFNSKVVVKAQVLVGGRGKAGGIKLIDTPEEAEIAAQNILSMKIKCLPVKSVLISKAIGIVSEYYLGITIDRTRKAIVIMVSAAGGIEIEEVASVTPDRIIKIYIDSVQGLSQADLITPLKEVFKDNVLACKASKTLLKMYNLFIEKDCSLVEINPYVQTSDNELVAIDAKINFDDNALYKHPDICKLKNPEEYSADEIKAQKADLSFVSMDGDLGCIVNGAGLAMATMDVIKLFGGNPANFLDVGGSSKPDKVLNALKIILSNRQVKAVLINIFGGITRCDDVAKGIIMAKKQLDIKVPLIIRLIGTNQDRGRDILKNEGFVVADEMSQSVKMAVQAVNK